MDKTTQNYSIEYNLTVIKGPGIEPRIVNYKDKEGGIVSNAPAGKKAMSVIEACKGLARKLNVEQLNIMIQGN